MKRLFASLLALVMLLSYVPTGSVHVHAEEAEEPRAIVEEAAETPVEVTEPATEAQEETLAPTEEVTEPVTEPVEEAPTEEVTEPVTESVEETEPATEPVEVTDPVVEEITVETPAMEATAENVTADGLEYSVADGEVTITGYSGTATELVIPSQIDGMPVTEIGNAAFYKNCSNLTSITVPNSVQSIYSGAFSGCFGLTSITLPFVGGSRKTETDIAQYPFGYIFGTNMGTSGTYITQRYHYSSTSSTTSSNYYIPSNLTSVTITDGEILYGAFYD